MTFQFHSPWWFLLVPLIVLAMAASVRRRPPAVEVSDLRPFAGKASRRRRGFSWPAVPVFLYGIGLLLLTVALARPRYGIEQYTRRSEGIDIMLALDMSGSMQSVYDNVPEEMRGTVISEDDLERNLDSRLEVAIDELERFVRARGNDRFGLIAFARKPYVVSPPTLDHEFLLGHLRLLEKSQLPDGTGIAAPIGSATARLKNSEAKRRVLVLFSDGADNASTIISPRQAAKVAKTFDVIIYAVGIGGENAFVRRNTWGGAVLQPTDATYDQALLEDIAGVTGGRFFAAEDADAFRDVMDEINEIETVSLEAPTYTDYRELFVYAAAAGLAVLLVAYALENSLFLRLP